MTFVDRMDSYGKGAWMALIVLGFAIFWPIGLTALAFVMFSGRMSCRKRGHWHNMETRWSGSGNAAFDEYRRETLKRLEDEQKEFQEYLEKLRQAKDKAEFDQFMADRRRVA